MTSRNIKNPALLLSLAYATLFVAGMGDNARGPILPDMIGSLSLSDAQASLFFSVSALASMPGSLLMGQLLRRFSSVACMRIAVTTFACGFLLISMGSEYYLILLGSALYGLGMGGEHVVVNIMVTQATSLNLRTRHMSLLQVMYGLASLLAPLIVIYLRGWLQSWQAIFVALAILPLLLVLLSFKEHGDKPPSAKVAVTRMPFMSVLRDRTCMFYSAMLGIYVAAELCVSLWLVLYLTRVHDFTENNSALYLTLFFAAMTLARLFGGFFLSGERNQAVLLSSVLLGLIFVFCGLYIHPLFFPLAAAPLGLFFPVAFASLSQDMAHEVEAAMSWVLCFVFISISLGQSLMGFVSNAAGMQVAMHVPIVLFTVVALLLLLRKYCISVQFAHRK